MIVQGMKARASLGRAEGGHMLFALLLLAQFQLWDGIMTQLFVSSGLAREANSIIAPLINDGGFLAFKLLGIAALLPLLWLIHKRYPRVAFTTACCLSIFYIGVISWNFVVLFN